MLQMSEIQSHSQDMSCQERYLRPLRRSPPYKDMCGKTKCQQSNHSKVPQVQRQSFHSQREMSLPPRGIPEDEKIPVSRQEHQYSSQICVANPASDCTNPVTHDPETSGSDIPECTTIALDGRLSGNHVYYRGQRQSYTWSNKQTQIIISTNQPASYIRNYNTTEEAIRLRGLETSRKETIQLTTTAPTSDTTQSCAANTRVSATSQTTNTIRSTTNSNHQNQQTRLSNVLEGYSRDKPSHHDHATAADVSDVRHSAQPVYSQHTQGHITEHARDNTEVRVLHWNDQGLNSPAKQSALIAALQLDHIDIAMIQDSRIVAKKNGIPPIRVPNCHTYFIPASPECHGLLTIIRNNIPSKSPHSPPTSDGTEVLTVKVWIDKKPTLLHNTYRVRGDTAFTDILNCRLPGILAGDFNAHHTMWCRYTDGPGRKLLDQVENASNYAIMNYPQTPTTTHNTTIDLTIVHTSLAPISEWSIYGNLRSDHYPIMLKIQTENIPPLMVPIPKWCLHEADWPSYQTKLTQVCATLNLDCSIDETANQLTDMLIQAAESTIPKTKPHKQKRKYWCYNKDVRQAKWSLNRALRTLRRMKKIDCPNIASYEPKAIEASANYSDICNITRNKSWDAWLTKNNHEVNSKMIWQRIKRCTGTIQRPPQHPDPIQESNRLLSEFVARSSSDQLPEDDVITLQQQQPLRQQQLYDAINSPDECDGPIALSELNNVLNKVRDSAPGDDTIVYSMLKNAPRTFLHQLTHLYTRSLQDGRLPSCWKTATIVPIPKKNNTYRPISLVPVLGKVMEKIILQRIRWSAEPPNTRATGFKPGSGTRDAVSILLHDISSFQTRRRWGAVVYLDLQKAFELVNKDVILAELATAGLHGRLLAWTSDFLTDRRAKCCFQNCTSNAQSFENGTPQGSSLSLTLFNYAMNIFIRLEFPEGVRILTYADDIVIYCVDRKNILMQLQTALNTMVTAASTHDQRSPLQLGSTVLIQIPNCNCTTATSTGQTAPCIWE